jgi:hypothetical protein
MYPSLNLTPATETLLSDYLARFDLVEGPAISEPEPDVRFSYSAGCSAGCRGTCDGSCTGSCHGSCQGDCTGSCEGDCKGSCSGSCKCGTFK